MAGRAIGGDRIAHAATRNMACCAVTGQAAGIAAALSVRTKCEVAAAPGTGRLLIWDIYVGHNIEVDLATGAVQRFHDISADGAAPHTPPDPLSPTGIAW